MAVGFLLLEVLFCLWRLTVRLQVVRWYAREHGLRFNALEPMNEPQEGFWKKGNRQEGCSFTIPDIDKLFPLVAKSIKRKGLRTALVGIDSGVGVSPGAFRRMKRSTVDMLTQFHVHGYTYRLGRRADAIVQDAYGRMRGVGQEFQREVWLSEWGPARCAATDDLTLALCMGKAIIAAVNILRASAWFYWQVIDSEEVWTLVDIPWDYRAPFRVRLNKKFWVWKHFTDSVPGGSEPIALPAPASSDCSNAVAAFYIPSRWELTMLVVNDRAQDETLTVDIQGFRRRYTTQGFSTLTCRTNAKVNFKCFSKGVLPDLGVVQIPTPSRSLTRVTFSNVAKI